MIITIFAPIFEMNEGFVTASQISEIHIYFAKF
jgi:hypothetical protein